MPERYLGGRRATGQQRYHGEPRPQSSPARFTGDPSATAPNSKPAEKKKRGGFLGAIERIPGATASDIAAAAVGLGPGLYHSGQAIGHDVQNYGGLVGLPGASAHPKLETPRTFSELLKPQAKATVQDFQHPLRHPFYTFQDVLAVASLGAGAASKAGLLGRERALLETPSPRRVVQGEGPVQTQATSHVPLVRGRQRLARGIANQASSKIEAKTGRPVAGIGPEARYGRGVRRVGTQAGLAELPPYSAYVKAYKKLRPYEKKALNILPRGVHPDEIVKAFPGTEDAKIAADPKVRAAVLNPSPRLQAADAAARTLSQAGAGIFKEMGMLGEENAAARPGLYHDVVSKALGQPAVKLPGEPYYLPDTVKAIRQKDPFAGMGAGKGIPRTPGTAKFNAGVNARLGRIDFTGDVLGPEFLRRVHLKVHTTVANELRKASVRVTSQELAAIRVDHGGALPKGWELLTAPVVGKTTGALRPQRISPLTRLEGDVGATSKSLVTKGHGSVPTPINTRELVPNPADLHTSALTEPFSTPRLDEKAYYDGQFYYLAPKSMVKAAAGEFHRSSSAVRLLLEKPLQVWRALILGLRVGFLTNNVVGNNILYAIKTSGRSGLRSYLHAVLETHGAAQVRQLLHQKYVPKGVTKQFMDEFFPEQVEGTFGRTQSPATSEMRSRIGDAAQKAKLGIIPATQAVAEGLPRRAAVEAMIRSSPEFKAVYRSLPHESRSFERAARKVLTGRGGAEYQRFISDEVNHALGNYLNLSPVERNAIRNFLPFYSWYRAIATIAYRLQVDNPVRALIVSRLGQIGEEDSQRILGALPGYLRGFIPIGKREGDIQPGLSTGGLNPFATIPQVGTGVTSDITSLGLAPYISIPLAVAQKSYGKPFGLASLLGQGGASFATSLPQVRLAQKPKKTTLYPQPSRAQSGLSFLGVPYKRLNVAEANRRASGG